MSWGDLGILASILGVLMALGSIAQALILGRSTTRLQAAIHAATQTTMADLGKGFRESQERMDARWREAFERMDQRADERHREVLQAESFNQVVTPIAHPLLYSPLRTGMPMSEREDSDACMSPMPE